MCSKNSHGVLVSNMSLDAPGVFFEDVLPIELTCKEKVSQRCVFDLSLCIYIYISRYCNIIICLRYLTEVLNLLGKNGLVFSY